MYVDIALMVADTANMNIFATEKPMTPSWNLLTTSFKLLFRNFWLVFALTIAASIATSIEMPTYGEVTQAELDMRGGLALLAFAGLVWSILFMPAWVYAQVQLSRGKSVTFGEAAREGFPRLWRVIGLYVLLGLIIIGGLLLFIVPGLIFIRRYCLAPYYLVDKDLPILESMHRSSAATRPISGYMWGVLLVNVVFGIIGSAFARPEVVIGVIIGTIVTFIYSFALPLRYAEIEHAADAKRVIEAV